MIRTRSYNQISPNPGSEGQRDKGGDNHDYAIGWSYCGPLDGDYERAMRFHTIRAQRPVQTRRARTRGLAPIPEYEPDRGDSWCSQGCLFWCSRFW